MSEHWLISKRISGNLRQAQLGRFLGVTLDTYQETSGYMYLGRVMTTLQDTIRIHEGYIRDTCGIHAGYMYLDPRGSGALLIHVYKAPTLHLFGN